VSGQSQAARTTATDWASASPRGERPSHSLAARRRRVQAISFSRTRWDSRRPCSGSTCPKGMYRSPRVILQDRCELGRWSDGPRGEWARRRRTSAVAPVAARDYRPQRQHHEPVVMTRLQRSSATAEHRPGGAGSARHGARAAGQETVARASDTTIARKLDYWMRMSSTYIVPVTSGGNPTRISSSFAVESVFDPPEATCVIVTH
jgi:hypothetical protein